MKKIYTMARITRVRNKMEEALATLMSGAIELGDLKASLDADGTGRAKTKRPVRKGHQRSTR
jgi:hypothetical protein